MTLEGRYAVLRAVAEFRDLPQDALAALAASMREERFGPGETVVASGEAADRVFVLCEGVLHVSQAARDGVLRRLERGALLGELAFFADAVRTATVRAAGPCVLLSLPFDRFRAFLLSHPESTLVMTGRIIRALCEAEAGLATARRELPP